MGVRIARRWDRGVVEVAGADAAEFLHGVVTNTVKTLAPGTASLGALLTPQGKVLFDFLVTPVGDAFVFEIDRAKVADFVKRLGFYRLRAKVTITDRSADYATLVAFDGPAPDVPDAIVFPDPRPGDLGTHLDVGINGVPGTAMQAFGGQLNDVEMAAVITYQRNAFGNNMGDTVQPIDVYNYKKG